MILGTLSLFELSMHLFTIVFIGFFIIPLYADFFNQDIVFDLKNLTRRNNNRNSNTAPHLRKHRIENPSTKTIPAAKAVHPISPKNSTFKINGDLSLPHRLVRDKFIVQEDVDVLLDLVKAYEEEMKAEQGQKEAYWIEMVGRLQHETCRLEKIDPDQLSDIDRRKLNGLLTFRRVMNQIKSFGEHYYGTSFGFFQITFHRRTFKEPRIEDEYYRDFQRFDQKMFTMMPHIDNRLLTSGKDAVYASLNQKNENAQDRPHIQYTAVLYLHPLDSNGGDLLFVDVPPDKVVLRDVIPDVKECHSQRLSSCEDLMHREATATVVRPAAGKLVMFTSGYENIHGIGLIQGLMRRYNIIFIFSKGDNLAPWEGVRMFNKFYSSNWTCSD